MTCYFPLNALCRKDGAPFRKMTICGNFLHKNSAADGSDHIKVQVFPRQGKFEKINSINVWTPYDSIERMQEQRDIFRFSYSSDPYLSITFETFLVPCSKCSGCHARRAREWMIRSHHELRYHERSMFLNLTYDDANLPPDRNLVMAHLQCFFKRYRILLSRSSGEKIRYLACGEYGDLKGRPHYHALIFGHAFTDLTRFLKTNSSLPVYTSSKMASLWPYGRVIIGSGTTASAAYIARYVMKKSSIKDYTAMNRVPEFITMSRRPGIGSKYFDEFKDDCYPSDEVVIDGKRMPVPKFYDRCLEKADPELFAQIKQKRKDAVLSAPEVTFRSLSDSHEIFLARNTKISRCLDEAS